MRKAIVAIATAILGILGPFLKDFLEALATQRGWYKDPSGLIGRAVELLGQVFGSPWFYWATGVIFGVVMVIAYGALRLLGSPDIPITMKIVEPQNGARVPGRIRARVRTRSHEEWPQLFVFSGDNQWWPQARPRREGRDWVLECWVGQPRTPAGAPFKIVALYCDRWSEGASPLLPEARERSRTITVYRDESPYPASGS